LVDVNENVFGSLDAVDDAIQSNTFPHPPARLLYLVSKGKPTDPVAIAFLNWVLSDGQKYTDQAGYVKLSENVRQKQVALVK